MRPTPSLPSTATGLPQPIEAHGRIPAGARAHVIPADRRSFLRQLAGAAVLAAPVTAATLAQAAEPDAELVRLGAQFKDRLPGWLTTMEQSKRLSDIFENACRQARITARNWEAWCQLRIATGFEGSIEVENEKLDELNELSSRIRAIPAVSLAGLAVKAYVLLFDCGSSRAVTLIDDPTANEETADWEDLRLVEFVREVVVLARGRHV